MARREYISRFYRAWMEAEGLSRVRVVRGESDLLILCRSGLERRADALLACARTETEEAVSSVPGFIDSTAPLPLRRHLPPMARSMIKAARSWNVGPMAAVAGAVAHRVAAGLRELSPRVIVENGGDVYAYSPEPITFRVYPGEDSPFPDGFGFTVDASRGVAVCTSSWSVGPSWSAGRADAVAAVARDGAFADAAATSVANRISVEGDVGPVVASSVRRGLTGLVAMAGGVMAVKGRVRITGLKGA
jgi:hypothetical protein